MLEELGMTGPPVFNEALIADGIAEQALRDANVRASRARKMQMA